MEEMRQITLEEWMSWKEDIREKLRETAGNFVYIGYRLKQIRDSGMYGGAADIFEFAQNEYGLGKSTVSRFIAINEKFSEGGNSLELKAEYRDIGSSKLSEMLTLTDSECRLITERTTVKEIRELKNFSRQQAPEEGTQEQPPLGKCIVEYFRDKKQELNKAVAAFYGNETKNAAEIINPGGYRSFQKGLVFLFMYDYQNGVKYKTFGSQEITEMSWEEFLVEVSKIFGEAYEQGEKDVYGAFYGEPEKEEEIQETQRFEAPVATSQQEEEDGENPEGFTEGKEGSGSPDGDADGSINDTDTEESIEEPVDRHDENQRGDGCGRKEGSGEPLQEEDSPADGAVPVKEENKPDLGHSVPETEGSEPDSGGNDTESVKKETDGEERFRKETLELAGNVFVNLQKEMEMKAYRAALISARSLVNYLGMVVDDGD